MRFPHAPGQDHQPRDHAQGMPHDAPHISRYATAAISSTVTTARAAVWPEKLDQAAP